MSVYDPEAFGERVRYAALVISGGLEDGRAFDTCFEMYDGAAVSLALLRRAEVTPDYSLAKNLYKYLCPISCAELMEKHRDKYTKDLPAFAALLRAQAREYRTELTPTGEQTVIPGCEADAAPSVNQLELF